jgi:hypothetical protein
MDWYERAHRQAVAVERRAFWNMIIWAMATVICLGILIALYWRR